MLIYTSFLLLKANSYFCDFACDPAKKTLSASKSKVHKWTHFIPWTLLGRILWSHRVISHENVKLALKLLNKTPIMNSISMPCCLYYVLHWTKSIPFKWTQNSTCLLEPVAGFTLIECMRLCYPNAELWWIFCLMFACMYSYVHVS